MRRVAIGGLTLTQIDPKVLEELPPDVVAELKAGLPPSHAPFAKQGNLSPDASLEEDAVADVDAENHSMRQEKSRQSLGVQHKVLRSCA